MPHLHWYSPKALAGVLARQGLSLVRSKTSKEIQILGLLQQSPVKAAAGSESARAAFEQRLREAVARSFGSIGKGRRTIVWYKGADGSDVYWERRIFRGTAVVAGTLQVLRRVIARMPRRYAKRITRKVLVTSLMMV